MSSWRVWLVLMVLAGAGAWAVVARGELFGDGGEETLQGAPVRRGPLKISVVESGNLKAANSIDLKSEIEGQTTILYLVDEGERVEEGDVLCELDVSNLEERRVTQEIAVQNAESNFVAAKQAVEIQESQNQSDVDAAKRKVEFAQLDLKKYLDGDWPQQLQTAEDAILLSEEELKRAKDKLEWSQKLAEKGFITRTELEADELSAKRAELDVASRQRARDLLVEYDFPKQKKSLEADVEESRFELDRIRLRAEARLVDFQADLRTGEAKLDLEREKLVKIETQIGKAKIRAPLAGMVVYAIEGGNRWRSGEPIAEGTAVRERQKIVTIPVTEGMIAEVSLHESVLEQVLVGQRAVIQVDALPGRQFEGEVKFKSVLPDQQSWWANPNQRVYRTEVAILGDFPDMRPGMSCSVEIQVDEYDDTLFVPVQSVFLNGGDPVCFVANGGAPEVRTVEVGANTHQFVQILAGLDDGDTVLLSQPEGYLLEPALEEEADDEEGGPPGGGGGGSDSGGWKGGGSRGDKSARGKRPGGDSG